MGNFFRTSIAISFNRSAVCDLSKCGHQLMYRSSCLVVDSIGNEKSQFANSAIHSFAFDKASIRVSSNLLAGTVRGFKR